MRGILRSLPRPTGGRALLLACVIGAAGLLAALAGVCLLAIDQIDDTFAAREVRFVQHGLDEQVAALPKEQRSSTIWDDAVLRVRAGDQQWMEADLGVWMGTYFGHDRAYVLDPANQPVHAMQDGVTVAPVAFADDAGPLMPLVTALRAKMREVSTNPTDSTADLADVGVEDFVMLPGGMALASVLPILPDSSAVTQAPGTEYLHISVQRIDDDFVGRIAQQFDLTGATVASGTTSTLGHAVVPIRNQAGRVLGFITWEPSRPAAATAFAMAPALAVALVVLLAALTWLAVRLSRSRKRLSASRAQTQFLAFHDVLTSLPNRALFEDRLERATASARRIGTPMALLIIDIDRFKNINDTLGHPAGDELIRQVGQRLKIAVRDSDTVARLGGDEFAVVLTALESDRDAELLADQLVAAAALPYDIGGEPVVVSISVGVFVSRGEEAQPAEIQRKADVALYDAKARGRGRYQVFDHDMDEVVRRRRVIEKDLRDALVNGDQLRLVYQPLYAADGATLVGAEALLRWDHPVHGPLSPEIFIAIAEERGLIEQLGEFVLRDACRTAVATALPWIAVNISPLQLRNPLFAAKVLTILADTGLEAHRLQLEITEGVLLENTAGVQEALSALRRGGVRIALDDFGTGYSSMNYLGRYSVDKLKIDRSFVSRLGVSDESQAIVHAIVSLARSMKLQVTAEGVETEEQMNHLAAIGCNELQGFLLSRPITSAELTKLVAAASESPEARRA